jgi:hypothetical protein
MSAVAHEKRIERVPRVFGSDSQLRASSPTGNGAAWAKSKSVVTKRRNANKAISDTVKGVDDAYHGKRWWTGGVECLELNQCGRSKISLKKSRVHG